MNTRYRITAVGVTLPIAHGIVALVLKAKRTPKGHFADKVYIGGTERSVDISWADGTCTCNIAD